jgi:hypothetical protein
MPGISGTLELAMALSILQKLKICNQKSLIKNLKSAHLYS